MNRIPKIILGLVFVFALMFFGIVTVKATQVSASTCTITMTLKLTYRGPQVACLQTNLNITADGNFGPKTKIAVMAWQKSKGLTADGVFGPKSNAAWMANVGNSANFPAGCSSASGYSVSTGSACYAIPSNTFPSGCTSTSGFSITTGVSCLTGISTTPTTYKAGCTSTTAFSITTGLSCTTIPVTNTTPVFYGGGGGGGGRGSATIYPITAISAITGTVKVGQVLSAGAVTPSGATVSYQWQISTTEDGTYTNISGATSSTYTILASDVTKFIKVLATGTGSYNSTVTSTATTIIAPTAINITAIAGITVPAGGAIPTATIADTTQYTAIILWTGNPITFTGNTEYTAVITLTPKNGYTLAGVSADLFTVSGAITTNTANTGVITAVFPATPLIQLTISVPTLTTTKSYNSNTIAVVTAGTLSGVIGGDTVTVSAVATYDTKNVGTSKTITVVYTLGGADLAKYIKPIDYTVTTGVITQIQLTIANPTLTTSKEYDRTTSAVVTAGALSGVVGGDTVTVSAVATYDTPSVNTGKTITVVYSLAGADAGNYIKPIDRIVYSGIITQKQLTISSPTITTTKLYDRSTSVSATIGTLSGVIGTEDVTVSGVATYDNANVGTGKTITLVYTLSGAELGNYIKPVNDTTSSSIITAIQLTIADPILTTTKVYDANTSAVVTAGALSGILALDTVTVSAVATYDTALPGTSKTITVVYTLAGAQSGNYIKPVNYTIATGVITAIVINTPAIAGVTVPVTDATPVSSLADGTGYTATISWSPSDAIFLNTTIYTATITLTPQTGYTLTGVASNFFTVAGATATNAINTGVVSAVFPQTQAYATVPSAITLAVGSTAPVGGVTNVAIPSAGATDTTGVITGYVATSADKIKFTVTNNGGASTITINGGAYTSGADYQIVPTTSFPTVVVTTTQANRTTTVRTFIVTGPFVDTDGLTYGITIGADNKKWLDRNLGATRVATSFSDTSSYGYLFQWDRGRDGHQQTLYSNGANSATTSTLSSTDTVSAPDTAKFIMSPSSPYDWRSPQSPNAATLWAGANGGTNNVCPAGFHVPTPTEWQTWVTALGGFTTATCGGTSTCRETAFNSSLKLPVGGYRSNSDASLGSQGSTGYYWSSSVSGTNASLLYFNSSAVTPVNANPRATGFTVRCLKD